MLSYRINSLPTLPAQIDRMRFRKAVMAMSVHAVNRRWLQAEAGLGESEVDSLLSMLDGAGVLLSVQDDEPEQTRRTLGLIQAWRKMKQFLLRPIRLEGRGLHSDVVPNAPDDGQAVPADEDHWLQGMCPQTLASMRTELRSLLARHPKACRVLTHLGFLEHTLRKGVAHALPIEVLKQALDQLTTVGIPEGSTSLAILRSRLIVALLRDEEEHDRPCAPVEVDEIALSRFKEAERTWQGYADTQAMPH